ncbi:hypothetical protein VTK26DRAFT_479 [Humicola hyalothermophila]
MPRRRRQNHPASSASPEPAGSPQSDREQSFTDDDPNLDDDASPLPFYNTTFSAHRVSPLYLGAEPLTPNRLLVLAQRLRDRLVGDVVRGVEVGLGPEAEGSAMSRAGALERVEMRWVSVAGVLGMSREEWEGLGEGDLKALHIALRYEMAACTALLLPSPAGEGMAGFGDGAQTRFSVGVAASGTGPGEQTVDSARFLSLPLLLLRMPTPLKAVIGDFLSTTFDCRVSPMRLGTRSLVGSWEAWIRSAGVPARGPLAKDMVLSLGFHVPTPPDTPTSGEAQPEEGQDSPTSQQLGLRSIDVIIPAAELRRFVAAGKRLEAISQNKRHLSAQWGWENDLRKRRRLAGRLYEEGWEWRTASLDGNELEMPQPFTEALACYLKEHMALDMFHPSVRVVKIACGGFVMSETRLKLFTPAALGEGEGGQRGAVWELLAGLLQKAQMQTVV